MIVFAGLAFAGVTSFLGQNPAPPDSRSAPPTQPSAQGGNQNPAARAQPSNAALDQRNQTQQAGQTDRQRNGTDRALSPDSRQRQTSRNDEQEDAAWLGIFLAQRDNEHGATVAHVYPSGPAARAGVYPGDVIQQINGQSIVSGSELVGILEKLKPGDKAELTVLRDNEPLKLTAMLGSRNSFGTMYGHTNRHGGQASQYGEESDQYNYPLHSMELEHNRRNAEQHQRIENEIAKLRDEVRQLRETLQRR